MVNIILSLGLVSFGKLDNTSSTFSLQVLPFTCNLKPYITLVKEHTTQYSICHYFPVFLFDSDLLSSSLVLDTINSSSTTNTPFFLLSKVVINPSNIRATKSFISLNNAPLSIHVLLLPSSILRSPT